MERLFGADVSDSDDGNCCCDEACACDVCDAGSCAEDRDVSGDAGGDTFELPHNVSGPDTINNALSGMGHTPSAGTCGADGADALEMVCQFGPGSWSNGFGDWVCGFVIYRSLSDTIRARAFARLFETITGIGYVEGAIYEQDVAVSGESTVDCEDLIISFSLSRCSVVSGSGSPSSVGVTVTFA